MKLPNSLLLRADMLCEKGDYKQALRYYDFAARQGCGYAQQQLAEMFSEGCGVEKDEQVAAYWMEQSRFYDEDAIRNRKMEDSVTDEECKRLADEEHNLLAMHTLGCRYVEQERYVEAVPYLQEAASHGDGEALYQLAVLHEDGQGVEQSWDKAMDLYVKSADQGHVAAARRMMEYYIDEEYDLDLMGFYQQVMMGNFLKRRRGTSLGDTRPLRELIIHSVPRYMQCQRCGDTFYDTISYSQFTCSQCHEDIFLCHACRSMSVNCMECGEEMQRKYGGE